MPVRRLLLLLSAAALAALLLACSGDGDDNDASPAATQAAVTTATPYAVKPAPTIVSGLLQSPQGERTYVVVEGDTLGGIAEQFGTTPEAIIERNNIDDPTGLFIGQELVIPVSGDDADAPADSADAPADSGGTASDGEDAGGVGADGAYEVQSGDLASLIAERFGVTLEELAAANGLSEADLDNLQPGDRLIIPGQ